MEKRFFCGREAWTYRERIKHRSEEALVEREDQPGVLEQGEEEREERW